MSTVHNKTIVNRYYEAVDKGDTDGILALCAADYKFQISGLPEPITPETYDGLLSGYHSAFPGFHHTLGNQVAEGDKVAMPLTFYGTHQGEFQGLPPTGKQVVVKGITIMRFANGKIVEHETLVDNMGMMQQLGAIAA